MPLRHSNKPAPRWLALCAGPFLVLAGLFAAAAIGFGEPLTFANALAIVLALLLAAAGVSLTIDQFRNK